MEALPPIGGNGCCQGSACKHSVWGPGEREAAGSLLLGLPWPGLFQTRIRSLRNWAAFHSSHHNPEPTMSERTKADSSGRRLTESQGAYSGLQMEKQKKMDETKHVKIQDMDVEKSPISQETEDNANVNELALELAKNVVTTAVKTVEDAENPIKNINWITHGEFTAERGRKQIEEFVLTWEYQDCWVHCTEFIEREDLVHSYHYIYCVHWSNPTANIPIAQVSASAYFTIKITKNKPPDMPIEVSYIFEGLSLVHRPGQTRFREKWLRDTIEAKNILMESIPF
ncbi:A-kinase anchor protein 14 isoform X1 [Canis lupus familiaris]|uniref:A-kinase anchor protein 14 isoform X1 n=1 Tax=Canis lupus familiaris TaxID=9615 RepID=UPI000BAA0C1F|nr:A-kinase anchor protein 14 isoform X1 [Canis lupus familiaris]XP_038305138.1 A-kinase anchor protein 14 isoform X1 [Canis lupus familiaris]XP_038444759.1 A-kinase anchor protein 14 isoform X1 [Canis lupus familiaris]|eukprot:XP_005641802.2 A-kinase anchor protein 14 isoform X1 [Canis lupus familiaris]